MDACVSLSIFHQNVELGSNTISSKVQSLVVAGGKALSRARIRILRQRDTVLLPLSNRIPSAGSRVTKRTRTARHMAVNQPKI